MSYIDPTHADSDDDGLTDGQELRGIRETNAETTTGQVPLAYYSVDDSGILDESTDPLNPDTDEDGYWDGWIGVHGVGYSDNVILYREHLHTGDGVEGDDEIVQEQIDTHPINTNQSTSASMGADINDDDTLEHSNVHVGELQWGTDPNESSETPDPTVRIEVDYHEDANESLRSDAWRDRIVDNYALYGVDIDFVDDSHTDVIESDDLEGCEVEVSGHCVWGAYNHTAPFSGDDLDGIKSRYHDTDSLYMFVGTEHVSYWGVAYDIRVEDTRHISIYTDPIIKSSNLNDIPNVGSLSGDEKAWAVTLKTTLHEIGHVLNVGEADDDGDNEIYSGRSHDDTIEEVFDKYQKDYVQRWSVMSGGVHTAQFLPPTNERYVAFSIEELTTISTVDTQVDG